MSLDMHKFLDMHIGRSFAGHPLEDDCPCEKADCGLVVWSGIDQDCPEHSFVAAKSIRQGHPAKTCKGTDEHIEPDRLDVMLGIDPNDPLTKLAKRVVKAEAALARVEALHPRGETWYEPGEGMVTTEDDQIEDGCQGCRTPWPCATIVALRGPAKGRPMIETTCPTCGGKALKPDPPARTQEEKVEFRKRWDAAVEESQK